MQTDFGIDLAAARAFLAAKEEKRERDERFGRACADFDAIVERIITLCNPRNAELVAVIEKEIRRPKASALPQSRTRATPPCAASSSSLSGCKRGSR